MEFHISCILSFKYCSGRLSNWSQCTGFAISYVLWTMYLHFPLLLWIGEIMQPKLCHHLQKMQQGIYWRNRQKAHWLFPWTSHKHLYRISQFQKPWLSRWSKHLCQCPKNLFLVTRSPVKSLKICTGNLVTIQPTGINIQHYSTSIAEQINDHLIHEIKFAAEN